MKTIFQITGLLFFIFSIGCSPDYQVTDNKEVKVVVDSFVQAKQLEELDVLVALDTSGSMYGPDLQSALDETQGVLKTLGGRGIRVLATDSQVHSRQRVTHASKIEVLGGGGTDMRVGLAEAQKLKPSPDLCIVLTDGYTPWPDRAPKGMQVIVAITGGHAKRAPDWARTVSIEG